MNDAITDALRQLLRTRTTAALGTLQEGAPYVSMVPYALLTVGPVFLVHVSKLAAHTNNMLADPRVSLMITEQESPAVLPQALPRLMMQGSAKPIKLGDELHATAKQSYLERFPSAAPIFQLGDFSLFTITPTAIRWIAGFGQAYSLTSEALRI